MKALTRACDLENKKLMSMKNPPSSPASPIGAPPIAPAHSLPRRSLFKAGASLLAAGTLSRMGTAAAEEWHRSLRLPDPAVKSLSPAFDSLINGLSTVERLATGFEWTEGPVWFGVANVLLFSDVRGNRIMKWDPMTGETTPFRAPSDFSNGNTVDREGRLLTCECATRRITRTNFDGTIEVMADSFDGKPFNSPNDIVCKSDGSIWFTDPDFGPNFAEGAWPPSQKARVYRIDPKTKHVSGMLDDVPGPNGLCFSPDEKTLYVVASRHKPNRQIWAYDVGAKNSLSNRRVLIDCGKGAADGLRVDIHGNLWCGWGQGEGLDGVAVFDASGKQIGHIALPERCPNVAFGGPHRNELFMACHSSIYKLTLKTQGVPQTN